ncbi:MAG: amino acid permease [Planctomycetota bacterium]
MPEGKQSSARFGTFGGVFTPCVLTILGVIMFLRFSEVVGNAGVVRALGIVLAAKAITVLTGLSLAAIATNTRTKGGGAYFLISRSLGVEFGGTIGLVFFTAQAISSAMYVIGFAEAFTATFPVFAEHEMLVATVTNALVFVCVFVGAGWTIKLQYAILAVLLASIVSFGVGAFDAFDAETLRANLGPRGEGDPGLVAMFALFFPAVTGIMAGSNMSGDLADPARSIPRGTLAAILFTGVIYLGIALLLGAVRERGALLTGDIVMAEVAAVPLLITAGVFAATISSALGSMMGAPRILQAFARDRILPVLGPFARGSGAANEPRRATVLTFAIAQACILLGDLNAIAPIITMAFMITYGTLNLATFTESVTGNPSYRPSFRWCHWSLSLVGAVACVAVMFLISWSWALVSVAAIAFLYWLIAQREVEAKWGDLRSGLAFERARKNIAILEDRLRHPKNWRPMLLTLSGAGHTRRHLAVWGHWLTSGHGIQTLGQVIEGELPDLLRRRTAQTEVLRTFIRDESLAAFPAVVVAPSVRSGVEALVQAHGLGGLEPNTVLLGWPTDPARIGRFCDVLRTISGLERSVVVVRSRHEDESIWEPPPGPIDVWWRGRKNGPLMLLLAHLLRRNQRWRNRTIRLRRIVPNEAAVDEVKNHLKSLARSARIDARCEVFVSASPRATIAERSKDASVVLLGLEIPADPEQDAAFVETVDGFAGALDRVLLVDSAGGMDLET